MLDNDSSSKLCFEEKSSNLSFVINRHVIFKNFSCEDHQAQPWSPLPNPMPAIPAKNRQEIHHQFKNKRKQTKIEFILKSENVKFATLQSGLVKMENQNALIYKIFSTFKFHLHAKDRREAELKCGRAKTMS